MQEQGVVARVLTPGQVEVTLQATEGCSRCSACHRNQDGHISIEAVGPADLSGGERVEIDISTGGVVAASFVVYLLPILFLIVGYGFGSTLAAILSIGVAVETAGIVGALAFLGGSFGVVRWYDRRVHRSAQWQARVIRVLPAADSGPGARSRDSGGI